MKEKVIKTLTRVEGLGRMRIKTEGEDIREVRLEIFEPPRFFESIVKGKSPDQVLDIVARICGLCPVAYQMSGVEAFENLAPAGFFRQRKQFGTRKRKEGSNRKRIKNKEDGKQDHRDYRRKTCTPGKYKGGRILQNAEGERSGGSP